MDPRRLLILACLGLTLSGCAVFRQARPDPTLAIAPPLVSLAAASEPACASDRLYAPSWVPPSMAGSHRCC